MSASTDSLAIEAQARAIASLAYDPGGLPSLVSQPEKVQILLGSLRDGNYREVACRQAGIAKQTFYNYLKRAEQGEEAAIALVDAIENAEADAEGEMVGAVRKAAKAGPQFWAAGMTYLERKAPDRWGRRQDDSSTPKVVVQIGIRDSDVTVHTSLSPDTRNDLAE